MSRDQDFYLRLKRKRILCLDSNDQFLESGDMVSFKAFDDDECEQYELLGLIVGPGHRRKCHDFHYNLVSVLWENGGCGQVPSEKLTLYQARPGARRSHALPPLKRDTKSNRTKQRRTPTKIIKRRPSRVR